MSYGFKQDNTVPNIPSPISDTQLISLQSILTTASSQSHTDNGLEQSDAAQAIFECWFAKAKQYASTEFSSSPTSNVHANMRRMTVEALSCLVGIGAQNTKTPFLCGKNLDSYSARSLLEHATQILVLHSTKPKFKKLLLAADDSTHQPSSKTLLAWIQDVFCRELTRVVCCRGALDSTRLQTIATLKAAQELGESLLLDTAQHSSSSSSFCPIELDPQDFINLAVQSNIDVSVRGTAGELITTICRCIGQHEEYLNRNVNSKRNEGNPSNQKSHRTRLLLTQVIAQRGMDDKAFTLGWRLGLLDNANGINAVVSRIKAEAQRQKSSSSNESMSLSGNSRPLVSAILRSIYEISMNWRNQDVQDLGNEGKFRDTPSDAPNKNGDFTFVDQKHSEIMANVLRACDVAAKSLYQEKESVDSAEERSQEFLEALGALLETYPDSGALLELILHPLTLEGLSTVAGLSYRFSTTTWSEWLLPFLRTQLDNMSLRGISGRQVEQEVVDLLRDCARHFYLNDGKDQSHRTNLIFGKQLYYCVIEAMRHGYIETEGFSRIAAVVLARHMSDGSNSGNNSSGGSSATATTTASPTSSTPTASTTTSSSTTTTTTTSSTTTTTNNNYGSKVDKATTANHNGVFGWVRYTLSDHVCHSLKTVRAIHEIFLTLLGLESSSGIGFDFDHSGGYGGPSSRSQSEQENVVLSVTTRGSTQDSIAGLSLWSELCTSYPVFVEQHESVVTQLLLTICDDLDSAVRRRGCSVDWWAAVMRMLCVLSRCITSFNAPLLFDQVLKIMALCPAGEAGSLAAHCGDSTVASIVDKILIPTTATTHTHARTIQATATTAKETPTTQEIQVEVMTTSPPPPPISYPAVLECTRRAGVLTRVALSRIVPELLLLDYDARVRVQALKTMHTKPNDAVLQASGVIFGACTQRKGKNVKHEHDGSHNLHMNDRDIGLACAPLVARLAVLDKTGACVVLAVERLLWAARITKEGSHLGQVDQIVLDSLSRIPVELEPEQLRRFCTSKEGHKWLGRLNTLSSSWERAVSSLVKDGKLIKSGSGGSSKSNGGGGVGGGVGGGGGSSSRRRSSSADRMYDCFEVPQGHFAKDLPVCTVITVEDAPDDEKTFHGGTKTSSSSSASALEVRNGVSVNIAKMSQPQATAVVLEGIVVPNDKGKSWAGLNAARQEGQWDWTRSSVSGENVMPVANGVVVDVFDYTKLPEAPTNVPRPGASKRSSDGGDKVALLN